MSDAKFITSGGEEIPVIFQTRTGLCNITIRPKIAPLREIYISKPRLTTSSRALAFLEQKRVWLERFFARAPEKTIIKNGDIINFLGRDVKIIQNSSEKSNFYAGDMSGDNLTLIIGGAPEMLESRTREFIKKEFMATVKTIIKTAPPEFWPNKIAIRDTASRWGSCSSSGTISFSWRLAFAPPDVMRYVIMHELAHIKHMNHSPNFWAQVSILYGIGVGRSKIWLVKNGATLHKYF